MLEEFNEVLDIFEVDDGVQALLITGAGDRAFCGGADLQFMSDELEPFDAVAFSQ